MAKSKPRCRLYLHVPVPQTARAKAQLTEALAEVTPAGVLLRDHGPLLETASTDAVIDLIQGTGAACLLENQIDSAAAIGADGVQIDADLALYARARAALGESANIGVSCGMSRHDAMALAEAGADYIAFGTDSSWGTGAAFPEESALSEEDALDKKSTEPAGFEALCDLIAWWSEIFVVPAIAFNIETVAEAERLTTLGVDFISPPVSIWNSDNALETLCAMDSAIGRIRRPA